jgi:ribosomal-protein-serine acetyltransferase
MTSLAPLAVEHFETVAGWLSQPDINSWLSGDWREKKTTATVVAVAVRNRKNRFFLVVHDGQPCGLAALSDIEVLDKTAMVWYFLGDQKLTGKGITSDAVRQVVSFGFSELGLESIYAWAMEPNAASIALLAKVGFREAGRIRRSAFLNGHQVDRIYFDITSESPAS